MFATIRRHQSWLWVIVIVGVIVPFVWFMGPTSYSRGGNISGGGVHGYVGGEAIGRKEFLEAQTEVRIGYFLATRSWPTEDDVIRRIPERLFLIWKQRQLGIQVSDEAAAEWVAAVFRDRERNTFSLQDYRRFVGRELASGRITEADFNQFARHEVGTRHLGALGAISGSLVPPRELESLFRREHEQVTTEIAFFSLSNRLAEVLISEEAVAAYYTNNAARYRVPERVQVVYTSFAHSNHIAEAATTLAAITNLSTQLDAVYAERGADAFRGLDGQPLTPEAAREQIRQEYLDGIAASLARKQAIGFAEQLYTRLEQEPGLADPLETLAASNQLAVAVTEPFTRFARPRGLLVGQDFASAAFALTAAQPMANEPILGQDAAYVIALKQRLEGYVPPLDERRPVVEADYRRGEALQAAQAAAQAFHQALTNDTPQGLTFAAACSNHNITPIRPPAFARNTQSLPTLGDRIDLSQLKSVALNLAVGTTSPVEFTADGAMIVHLISREPVDEARLKAELPAFAKSLREEQRQEALMHWFQRELDLAHVDLPVLGKRNGKEE